MKQGTNILERINDLRITQREMRSKDVREAIEAAITDCERQLGIVRTDGGEQSPQLGDQGGIAGARLSAANPPG